MMKVAIIDYGAGNVRSVQSALAQIGVEGFLTNNAHEIQTADKVIFPGVGHAAAAMKALQAKGLDMLIPKLQQPVLGICLGMQLMCTRSEEGDVATLGIFPETVKQIKGQIRVPHTGWNNVEGLKTSLFLNLPEGSYVYFNHGYYVPPGDYTIATATYGEVFSSAVRRNNFYGCQFHPEKSAAAGMKILENFTAF